MESGEAMAVSIVRNKADGVDTRNKWIDVLAFDNKSIKAEVFHRLTRPEYTGNRLENKYLTWCAAHDDIDRHRRLGHKGKLFIISYRCDWDRVNMKEIYTVIGVQRIYRTTAAVSDTDRV